MDIETSNLSGDFGIILSYCIKSPTKLYKRVLTSEEIRNGVYDRNLLKQFCKDILNFDRVVTYYGAKFDIPFLRTRCLFWNLSFPVYSEVKHTDAYLIMKYKFNLHSKRLGVVAPFFGIPAKQHSLNPAIWFRCMSGNKSALKFVLTHNIEDVVSLEGLWKKVNRYVRITKTSM